MQSKARFRFALVGGVSLAFAFSLGATATETPLPVVISRSGFRPERIQARKGETLRLAVTTADEEHCFAIDEFRVEKRVLPKRTVTVELTPDHAGRFDIYCCLEPAATTPRGQLVVVE